MGLFDRIFNKKVPQPRGEYDTTFRMMTGYSPRFTTWSGGIYESELIRAAINACATHISKLKVETRGSAKQALQNKLKHGPNKYQTWSQFLYRLATILYVHNTAFILPIYDEVGEISGIYSPLSEGCEIAKYGDKLYLRYRFHWGDWAAIEFENVGVLTRFQYRDDIFGEGNAAMIPTLELIKMQNEGIREGVKSAATYRFMAKVNNFSKADDLAKERDRFTEKNFGRDVKSRGILLFPNTYTDIKQIEAKPWIVDADQMKIIKSNVFEYIGVNEDVLMNKAYGDAWSAFYEGVVEVFAIQFSETLTKMLFTYREQSQGNFVMATANRLQYMSNSDKLKVSAQLLDRGVMSLNDVREIWNLPPVEGGDARILRGEYYNADEKINVIGEDNDE